MEMVAVIAVTSFLLVMTINVMKTDPSKAQLSRLGGACQFSSAKAAKERKNVIVEFDGVDFIASYVNDSGVKTVIKQFTINGKVEAKMEKDGNVITSYSVTPQGTIGGGGAGVIFKVRKIGDTQALFFTVNGFTSRVFYYDTNGDEITSW
jgi:hypothetical protein